MKHLKYINRFFVKYKWRFLLGVLFVIISNVFGILPPIVIRHAFDLVKENIDYYQLFSGFELQSGFYRIFAFGLFVFGITVVFLAFMKGLFMFFMRQTLIVMSRLIEYDLRNVIYSHYQKLDLAFYKQNKTGDMMSRVAEDVSRVRMYIGPAIMYSINTLIMTVMVISVMISVNSELTLYVLLPLPVLSISIFYVSNIINKKSEAIQKQLASLTHIAQETFSGIRVIKSYVQEKTYGRFFYKQSGDYREKYLELARVESFFFPLMLLLIGLSTIITIFVGGIQVIQGKITAGNIAEFILYVNMLTWPVTSIGWVASIVQRAAASQKRINEFLLAEPAIMDIDEATEIDEVDTVEFNNVSFTYPETGVEALKEINLKIEKGERIAIVGRTGSGKSTLVDLMMRLYDVSKGEIRINNLLLQSIKLGSFREKTGFVPQEVFLFSDTIRNNIAFGRDPVPENTVIEDAAKNAAIHNEINALPEGYETFVGERGVTLSGGQKQRISIARAFVKSPDLLILDDCLSAVDAKTEKSILESLNTLLKDKTAIIITHRIFTLLDFDRIYVLDEGQILEDGTHDELLRNRGLYFELFEKQKSEEKYSKS